jgi:hypothetical protein
MLPIDAAAMGENSNFLYFDSLQKKKKKCVQNNAHKLICKEKWEVKEAKGVDISESIMNNSK